MAKMKVMGANLSVPLEWYVKSTDNRSRQRLVFAAVPSRAAFLQLLKDHGFGNVTAGFLRTYGYPDMSGGTAAFAAQFPPGTLLYEPEDNRGHYAVAPD